MTIDTRAPGQKRHDEHEKHEHQHDLQEIHEDVPPDFYDTSVKDNLIQRYWHGCRFKEVARLATKVDGRLLDVGCDGGTLTEKVALRARPERVVGVDISAKSLSYTMTKRPQFDLAVGDAEELPFGDATFAAIFCSEVMEHLVSPEKMLSEVRRCLRARDPSLLSFEADAALRRVEKRSDLFAPVLGLKQELPRSGWGQRAAGLARE